MIEVVIEFSIVIAIDIVIEIEIAIVNLLCNFVTQII